MRCHVHLYVMCSVGQISEEVAQEALLELVSRTRCYGTSAAREMDIYRIIPSCALHVRSGSIHTGTSSQWPLMDLSQVQ